MQGQDVEGFEAIIGLACGGDELARLAWGERVYFWFFGPRGPYTAALRGMRAGAGDADVLREASQPAWGNVNAVLLAVSFGWGSIMLQVLRAHYLSCLACSRPRAQGTQAAQRQGVLRQPLPAELPLP